MTLGPDAIGDAILGNPMVNLVLKRARDAGQPNIDEVKVRTIESTALRLLS